MTNKMENGEIEKQQPSIKLIKNSRGYNWEIKVISPDIDLVEKINNEMNVRFTNENNTSTNDE